VADLAGLGGRGLGVQPDPDLGVSGEATVFDSLFERNAGAGVYVLGSVLDMQRSAVAGTLSAELTGEGRGVSIQYDDVTGFASQANLSKVQVNGSREFGMFVQGSTVTLSDSTISATRSVDGLYGDGLALPSAGVSNQVIVSGSRIGDNERGGILLFDGSNLSLGSSELSCNAIDLVDGSSSAATQFDNQGGNACGCPAEPSSCKWVGTNVAAPLPLAPDDGSPDG
jgi:hypothetical protein